ncbi:c-5 sterol desaturase [Friedmanniomyces endolithicus]|uniref:C-5 sterol desaturase n=1 Tax=Friedmanniomyces endolithicus TaxID=329885 RepID=A0AAN6KJQ6_9PEZI|nr:c-5 sterol desaturase [Friedmanniomyces endolithicus]KAK0296585.1 c-5 sterol desaturase [Friedmanniomyces endolithicus]KAK0304605.1 c-5 sterol desaturase [Friedmanniomyces endolithicus]KAK0324737.1 c-5 sterol desaturase [Friedmanniomyces endolithicus]KAK0826749.1 c-5 sterol desaturase [Friedmanniomyces endolithicus]
MDVVLEVADTFLLDRLYATILPISSAISSFDPISTITASLKNYDLNNASFALPPSSRIDIAEGAIGLARSGWQWQPSTQWFNLEPSEWAWASRWDRDNVYRQLLSLYLITCILGTAIYFFFATLSYLFVFDKATFNHPKYLKNQIRLEIQQTLRSIPLMAILTVPVFVAEVRGHSYIYSDLTNPTFTHPFLRLFGASYTYLQFPFFLIFTDFLIYWIHRGLHSKLLYRHLHKPHHKWIMPTPFASLAFHPLDGYAQSVPYHLFPFLFPLHKGAYLALFTFVQIWTVMIHDGEYVANSLLINGAACHTMHHLYFNYNYGQFTTISDRVFGSYRRPNEELFVKETKMSGAEWGRQAKEMERLVVEVEGRDERSYGEGDGEGKKML